MLVCSSGYILVIMRVLLFLLFFVVLENKSCADAYLHRLVEDTAADLHNFQILLLLVACALDVRHPAALILLAGVDEVAHRAVLIEHLGGGGQVGG